MMIKRVYCLLILLVCCTAAFAQLNMQFRSQLTYGATNELANIGGYVDSTGREYALVGCQTGLSIVDVTNPAAPFQKVLIPGTNSFWREVKVWGKYAYVTTEGGTLGLQIINLGKLPGTITTADYKYWKGSGAILNQISRLHSLHIDNGYAYLNGVNGGGLFGGACLIVSLADPWNPVYTGNTQLSFTGTQRYMHDCYIRNDTLWGAHIYGGFFSIINVSNKSNPSLIGTGTVTTPGAFTHNAWLNTSGTRTLFTTDEVSNSFMTSYDVSNPSNITELDRVQLNPGSLSIVHNTHIKDNYAIVSWYKEGVAIVDVARPDNMIITGHYDTYSQGSGNGFNGCWGVYPFLPSGNIVASDINNGLFVLTPTYVRGCYLEGTITNACNGSVIPNATVTIVGANITKPGKLTGVYKTGTATAGTYSVTFSKTGYVTKTITNVSLSNGVLTNLNVQLQPISSPAITNAAITNVNCNGANSGSINITASGGTLPYQYIWSNGSNSEDIQFLSAGNYTITITDAAGCTTNASYTVSQPAPIQISFSAQLPSCIGSSDGSITAVVNGGIAPYSYTWNPLSASLRSSSIKGLQLVNDTVTLNNIPAGNYILLVTDANGCTSQSSYTLNDGAPCTIQLHVRLFTEGYYQSYMLMNTATASVNLVDTYYVWLAADTINYPLIASDTALADTLGNITFTFSPAIWNQSCYIVLRHRNSIETWSYTPILFNDPDEYYDFSASGQLNNSRGK